MLIIAATSNKQRSEAHLAPLWDSFGSLFRKVCLHPHPNIALSALDCLRKLTNGKGNSDFKGIKAGEESSIVSPFTMYNSA